MTQKELKARTKARRAKVREQAGAFRLKIEQDLRIAVGNAIDQPIAPTKLTTHQLAVLHKIFRSIVPTIDDVAWELEGRFFDAQEQRRDARKAVARRAGLKKQAELKALKDGNGEDKHEQQARTQGAEFSSF